MESAHQLGKPELVARLRARIEAEGPIPFSTFMREALYAPNLGYYSSAPPLGARGDFYTAVSIGPLFGRFLAWQLTETWQRLGTPSPFTLIEQGAHRGQLLADLLTEIRQSSPDLLPHLQTLIIEPDPVRRTLQTATLNTIGAQPAFVSHPSDLPDNLCGCFLANELPDSFPVNRARFSGGHWRELRVGWSTTTEQFTEEEAALPPDLADLLTREAPPSIEGFTIELCPEIESWFPTLLSRFSAGHLLLFDYALTREERQCPSRAPGTLRTYHHHRTGQNPLIRIGEQDITYHVHGTRLEEIGRAFGWTAVTLEQHRAFAGMIASFLPEGEERVLSLTPADRRTLQTLVHPAFLGRAFSALSFRKAWPETADRPSVERFAR